MRKKTLLHIWNFKIAWICLLFYVLGNKDKVIWEKQKLRQSDRDLKKVDRAEIEFVLDILKRF